MASVLTLQEAKDHLRVDYTDEDDKIWAYCQAAYDQIANFLNTPDFMNGESPGVYPEAVKMAARILVADMFNQTDANRRSAENCMYPYRVNIGI